MLSWLQNSYLVRELHIVTNYMGENCKSAFDVLSSEHKSNFKWSLELL